MANDREIIIKISADGTAAIAGIRGVGDSTEELGKRTLSTTESLKKNWLAVTAGITGAYLAFQKIWQTMEDAARTQEAFETLEGLTAQYGMSAEKLARDITTASQGLIGMASAASLANDAMAKGLTPEQLTNIAKWAPTVDDLSNSVGSAKEAFEALASAIATGRERSVVQMLGATIDLREATNGLSESMSKAEKSAILYNMVAERMGKILKATGNEQNSAADRMERFNNQLALAKFFLGQLAIVIGGPFMALFQSAATIVYGLVGGILGVVASLARLTDELRITKGAAADWQKKSDDWLERSASSALAAKENFAGALEQLKQLGQFSSGMKGKGSAVNLGMGAGGGVGKEAEAFAKGREKMLAALSKFQADTEAIRAAGIVEDQKAFESRLGLFRAEIAEKKQEFIDDQTRLDLILALKRQQWEEERMADARRLELEREITDLKKQQRDLIAEQQVASLQNAFSVLGAGDQGQRAGMIMSIQNQTDPYTKDYEAWEKIQDQKIERMYELGATEASLKDEYRAYELQQEQMLQQQKYALAANAAGLIGGIAQSLFIATGKKNREFFEIMKIASTAEAIINTATGATKALAQGGWFGIAMAAAIVAAGMAQVATIQAQQFNAPSSGGISVGGNGGGMPIAQTVPPPAPEKKTGPSIINFYVNGDIVDHDQFARTLLPYLNKAEAAGVA